MPFIACLNNVTTTHAKTNARCSHASTKPKNTRPTPQSRNEPVDFDTPASHPTIKQGQNPDHAENNYTYIHDHPPPPTTADSWGTIAKMLASTMQISNNNPTNPLTHDTRALERREDQKNPATPRPGHLTQDGVPADPSGPNSVSNQHPAIPHQREATTRCRPAPRPTRTSS